MGITPITVTGHAQRQAWKDKVLPPVELVRPGVLSIPVVFPGNPMRYTLCYALFDLQECVLIDPGFDSDKGLGQIAAALATAGLGLEDVAGVIATHFHIDHLGLALRIARKVGAWIALGEHEKRHISDYDDAGAEVRLDQDRMAVWGVPGDRVAEAAMSTRSLAELKALADPDLRLGQDQLLPVAGRTLRIAATPGHTPGHICLWDEQSELVLSGDHLLPRISPNVSLEIRGDLDPLRQNIASLKHVARNNHFEVLPAHEYRFRGVADRAGKLLEHISERSDEVLEVLGGSADSVYEVARKLTWSRGWESLRGVQFRLALSETAAHIQYLATEAVHPGVPGLPATAPA